MTDKQVLFEDRRRVVAFVDVRIGSRGWVGEKLIGANYSKGDSCIAHTISVWFLIGSLHLTLWWKWH